MSSELLLRTADVLEKAAAYFEREDQRKTAAVQQERERTTATLREKLNAANVEVPDTVLEKIANDQDVAETLQKLASQQQYAGPPDALGESHSIDENNRSVPLTHREQIKEAAAQSEASFVDWINS